MRGSLVITNTRSSSLTEALLHRNGSGPYGCDMEQTETNLQHLMLLVEAAQRAGHSETEIAKMVDDAVDADAELKAVA